MSASTTSTFANMGNLPATIHKWKTLIVVILDESGSMNVQQQAVIGGYNSFLKQQRELTDDKARLLLVKFNKEVRVGHGATDVGSTPELSNLNYVPSGGTALYDAVAEGIRIGEGALQPGERVLVLIMTDGEENSSRKNTSEAVGQLIRAHEALGNWTFAYIGANPERWSREMGQHISNTVPYDLNVQENNFTRVSAVAGAFRNQMCAQQRQCVVTQTMPPPPN